METKNVVISKPEWQDLETLGELTLEEGESYTISIRGAGQSEVCLASTEPEEDFLGHPVQEGVTFNFVKKTPKVWIKLSFLSASPNIVVIS